MSSPPPNEQPRSASRSSSLGSRFLRRSKSTEPLSERKSSGNRLSRKKSSEKDEEARRRKAVQNQPPKLPSFPTPPQLLTFEPGSNTMTGPVALPDRTNGNFHHGPVKPGMLDEDPYARTESMTHRGRYSYASSAVSTLNSTRRVRRRKDPTPYK